ncbi:TPA: hypothetical protein PIQ91_002730 [Staphylococcus aureus]|nr:hypothetical protein [Staphylococcus aureus]
MRNNHIFTFMPRKHFEKEKSYMIFQLVENVGGVCIGIDSKKTPTENHIA